MNRTTKLLSFVIAVLIVLVGTEAYILQTTPKSANISEPIRVACIGDSITRGTEYTLYLWSNLGPDYIIGDFGVGGTTVSINRGNPYMNSSAFSLAKEFKPTIVIIMLGTNDANIDLNESAPTFTSDYVKLVTAFQSLSSNPQIWLVLPPPIFDNSLPLKNSILVETILPSIQTVANQTGVHLIDANTPLLEYPHYFTDGVHPNGQGAQIIADAIFAELKSEL
jgi:acyl-CoA thioesterase I